MDKEQKDKNKSCPKKDKETKESNCTLAIQQAIFLTRMGM